MTTYKLSESFNAPKIYATSEIIKKSIVLEEIEGRLKALKERIDDKDLDSYVWRELTNRFDVLLNLYWWIEGLT